MASTALDYSLWNGRDLPYRPADDLAARSGLPFHRDEGVEVDPVTFEIVSTKLWNINEEHADTIRRASGSPIVVLVNDFNTSIMTEDGDAFLFAPYIQYFASASEYIIKYTIENRSENPGIAPGDVFVHNDPFIAGSHQQDVGIYSPVFVDDELFCWVFSACHVRDCGGTEPGGFCIAAPDIYHDPPMVRALKLADANGIRTDAEDTFLRMSRLPDLLALELRSQIAGANRARQRIVELTSRYGTGVVKRVMRKLIEDTEAAVQTRLERIPDGTWRDTVWISGAAEGDREVHRQELSMTKTGAHLTFDNIGTDPQFACVNCSFGQFRSAILCGLAQMLAFDHRYCVGGFANLVSINAEVGTINAVDRNGAVSALHAQLLTIFMATRLLSRMVYPDPELRRTVMATSGVASRAWLTTWWTDPAGNQASTLSLDEIGGLGALTFGDGVDQGGATFWPKLEVGDCESWEQYFPILYLYRRGARNGGHGKFRGGHGISVAWLGHGADDQQFSAVAISPGLPVQSGLFGGHWGQTGEFWGAQGTEIRDQLADGRIPGSFDELLEAAPQGNFVPPNARGVDLGESDVVAQSLFGGGGYGDALERDPALLVADLERDAVTVQLAEDIYGVVFAEDGTVDETATAESREARRKDRLARAKPPQMVDEDSPEDAEVERLELSEYLQLRFRSGASEGHYECRGCGHGLGPSTDNYKLYCSVVEGSLSDIDPLFPPAGDHVDTPVVYRSYLCPGCGVLFENELTLADEAPIWDTKVVIASIKPEAAG